MGAAHLFAAISLAAGGSTLPPVDQCARNASFVHFREELGRIAWRRDTKAIMAVIDKKVQIDLGGGYGKRAFAEAWRLDRPQRSRLWNEIQTILRLGCTADNGTWLMPSLGDQLGADADPLETYVAIVPGAALRSAPSDHAAAVTRLRWDVLRLLEAVPDGRWLKVGLSDGRQGYVRQEQVRNPLDYRMVVERKNGAFRITAFLAGD